MLSNDTGELIFEQWVASLKNKDRSKTGTPDNFDELFLNLKKADISFDAAHSILPRAIKAHLPNKIVVKNTWNKNKALHGIFLNEHEFVAEWNASIKSVATEAFFSHFPLKINDDEDKEPKIFGSMSAKEYRLQRKHAESYPMVNTVELIKRMKERQALNAIEYNVLGENDE